MPVDLAYIVNNSKTSQQDQTDKTKPVSHEQAHEVKRWNKLLIKHSFT